MVKNGSRAFVTTAGMKKLCNSIGHLLYGTTIPTICISHFLDAEDVLETCNNCLDDLWKLDSWAYPQQRMVHLMDIIAHAITR